MYEKKAIEIKQAFLSNEVSATEITEYFLQRIHAGNKELGAFLSVFEKRALEKAAALDEKKSQGKPVGKLAGIPVALKDNIQVKGERTTCASKFLENYHSIYDATVTRLLEQEGAIILGKTNLDEFAMGSSNEYSAFGPVKNPWNLDRVPGGSSGGSAAAVAAKLVPISFGSDTGGSIRQPASFCGISGFKPTYGRVSRYGLVAFASSLDQIGPFATNVDDIALVMEAIGAHCPQDSTSIEKPQEQYLDEINEGIQGKRVGVPWHFLKDLSDEQKEVFETSLNTFEKLGAQITEVRMEDLKYSVPVYYIIAPAEASTNLARFDGIQYTTRSSKALNLEEVYHMSRGEGFGREVKQRILLGTYVLSSGFQEAYYKKSLRVRELIVKQFQSAFETCDVIAMPASPTTAFELGQIRDPLDMYLQDLYTIPANLAGLPAISVPSGFDNQGLPCGVQIYGPRMEDARVLRFAKSFESEHNIYKTPEKYAVELSNS